jgi:segregation and condensation protein B
MDDITRPERRELPEVEGVRAKGPAEGLDRHLSAEALEGELMAAPGRRRIGGGEHRRRRGAAAPRRSGGDDADDRPAAEPAAAAADAEEDADGGADAPELSDPDELARVLLAVLLVAREAVSELRLAQVCNATKAAVAAGLDRLREQLEKSGMPIRVSPVGEAVQLLTVPEVFPYLKRLRGAKKADRLSPAALETLAVVAYRQPVIRAEIEAIRGVKVGPTLRTLLDHKLIDVVGRADVPGRPLQYGTTPHFLDRFGLSSLDDLPSVREFRSLG